MANIVDRIYTETPLIDEIVYQIKGMIMEGIVLKDEDEANKNETLNSIQLADKYSNIIEGKDRFEYWDYDYSTIIKLPYITRDMAVLYAKNNALIDEKSKPLLLKFREEEFLSVYEDQNNYYRKLNGLPNLGEVGVKLDYYDVQKLNVKTFDVGKYLHEMTADEINVLKATGVLEDIQNKYPDKYYLHFLGDRKIDPYVARKTSRFGVLYVAPCESMEVYNKFKDKLEVNRTFMLHTLYSQAFKFRSEYYDRFIMIMIIIQAFIDMIELSPEYIIQRELFDMRTIQYVFESQGVTFFPDIPLKYQKRLVKNLNLLIKYKACDKNLIDIVSLFGFDNIRLFKYYLLKDPIMLEDGTYKKDTYINPKTGEDEEDLEANYELKFLKVPIGEDVTAEEAIRNPFNLIDYDEIVHDDIYWNGIYTPEYVKHVILQHEYNLVISKYIGMEATYSLTDLCMQLCYFVNMIIYNDIDKSRLEIEVPELGTNAKFQLTDLFIALFSLKYIYLGMVDNIIYNPVQALDCLGFNFDADMNALQEYVTEQGFTLEELGVSNFKIPKDGIFTIKQLIEIYTNNKNIYDHLVYQITHANNKKMYDIYKKIYDSLMITKLNFDYFKTQDIIPKTYSEFLKAKNSPLYNIIENCRLDNTEERQKECSKVINYIVENIYLYIDRDDFDAIFDGIPTVSLMYIRRYVFEVLNFFKSYKVDFTHVNIVYTFDDRLNNWVNIIDNVLFKRILNKKDHVEIDDYLKTLLHMKPKDVIGILDIITLDITKWKRLRMEDYVIIRDRLSSILITLYRSDYMSPYNDHIEKLIYELHKSDFVKTNDNLVASISLTLKDECIPEDLIW